MLFFCKYLFQNLDFCCSRENFLSKKSFKHITKINDILCITKNTAEYFPIHLCKFSVAKLSCKCCILISLLIWSRRTLNSFMYSEKHLYCGGVMQNGQKKRGGLREVLAEGRHLSWWYCNTCVKGLFRFTILLCSTLVSSLALSLGLKEFIYDHINVVTNFFSYILFWLFFPPLVCDNPQVYTLEVFHSTSLIYITMFWN